MERLAPDEKVYLNPVTVQDVLTLLQYIPARVYWSMGVDVTKSHPSSCIISVLLVPSPNIRPSIMFSDSSKTRGQDGLTHKLQEILKTSQKLGGLNAQCLKNPGNKTIALSAQVMRDELQYLVATFYSNDVPAGATPPPLAKITGNFAGKRRRVVKKTKKQLEKTRKKNNAEEKRRKQREQLTGVSETPQSSPSLSQQQQQQDPMDHVDEAILAQAHAAPGTTRLANTSYVPSAHITTSVRKRASASSAATGSSSAANNPNDKSVMSRLKGKKGRIRGNNMGKRVDFCSRTTITPDNNLEVDEVGVPEETALILTRVDIVNTFNYDILTKRVHIGPNDLKGAKSVTTATGHRISLEFVKNRNDLRLQIGDRVERPLQDGDYVLFNREPTLHKKSLQGHSVKIMKGLTNRMNVAMTSPYNADFDGTRKQVFFS
jgi:DNA-directed RNA polymerase beta' subunit